MQASSLEINGSSIASESAIPTQNAPVLLTDHGIVSISQAIYGINSGIINNQGIDDSNINVNTSTATNTTDIITATITATNNTTDIITANTSTDTTDIINVNTSTATNNTTNNNNINNITNNTSTATSRKSIEDPNAEDIADIEDESSNKKKKRESSRVNWNYTFNNYHKHDVTAWLKLLDPHDGVVAKYHICGEEVGESGTPHLQGFLQLQKKLRHKPLKELFVKHGFGCVHFSAVTITIQGAIDYCRKDGKILFEGGKVSFASLAGPLAPLMAKVESGCTNPAKLRKEFPNICARNRQFVLDICDDNRALPKPFSLPGPYYPWQNYIIEYLSRDQMGQKERRQFLFVVDYKGHGGKSDFVLHLCTTDTTGLTMKLTMSKKADMFHAIKQAYDKDQFPKTIFVDCARAAADQIQYGTLEDIKTGMFNSTKYSGGPVYGTPPFIVIMMNELPNLHPDTLSVDRYHIVMVPSDPSSPELVVHEGEDSIRKLQEHYMQTHPESPRRKRKKSGMFEESRMVQTVYNVLQDAGHSNPSKQVHKKRVERAQERYEERVERLGKENSEFHENSVDQETTRYFKRMTGNLVQ